ncbi:MAG TPA: helix-turn-helix domain-containing protein [Acidimicrobiales bacterium]
MATGPRSEPARERIIVTAERLFAQRGINGVSLREIGAEAGQRNNSASQYHFGSKVGLIEAIFALRMSAINARRLEALADLDRAGMGSDLRGLVEAYIHPLAEPLDDTDGERWWVRFLANVMAEPRGSLLRAEHREFTTGIDEVFNRLGHVLAHLPEAVRQERLVGFNLLVVNVLAGREGRAPNSTLSTGPDPRPDDPLEPILATHLLVADLVDMTVGLLTAPVSTETTRLLLAIEPGAPQSVGANVKSAQETSASVTSAPDEVIATRTQATSPDIEIS